MSETLRVYNEFSRRRKKSRGGFFRFVSKLLLLAIIVLIIVFYWTTRDLFPVEQFLPAQSTFQVFSPKLMQNYQTIISSPLWELADPSSSVYKVKRLLTDQQKVPLWIIRHLIYDFFYFSANDLNTFEDALLIFRLSRVGCLIEQIYTHTQPVELDWAGGINLRYIPGQKLYYARKGRILFLSPNRETLLKTITQKRDFKTQTLLARELLINQEKHLAWGTFTPQQTDFQGLFPKIHFYISLSSNQIGIRCETQIIPDPETPWTILLADIVSPPLQEPADSLFSCSIDTGVPVKTWLRAFETIPQASIILPQFPSGEIPFMEWIKSFSPFLDNQFQIAMDTLYTDEIIPFIPKYCIAGKIQPNICENINQVIIEPTILVLGEKNKAIPSPDAGEFIVPLIGSSQTDLHIQCAENQIIFTNNKELRDRVVEHIKNNTPTTEGNYSLLLQMKPEKIIEEFSKALTSLEESHILQFQNPEKVTDLIHKIKLFKEIKIKMNLNKGNLKIAGIAELNTYSTQ